MKLFHLTAILIFCLITTLSACGGDSGSDETGATESASGSLSESDTVVDGKYVDTYVLENVPDGAEIWAEVEPSGFDAVLMLTSDDVSLYTADSESCGVGCNESFSEYVYEYIGPGQYRIFVTSYAAGETGSYTLRYSVTGGLDDEDDSESDDDYSDDSYSDDYDDDDDTCHSGGGCGDCYYFSYTSCSCVYMDIYCRNYSYM